jgi:hypothetical protein
MDRGSDPFIEYNADEGKFDDRGGEDLETEIFALASHSPFQYTPLIQFDNPSKREMIMQESKNQIRHLEKELADVQKKIADLRIQPCRGNSDIPDPSRNAEMSPLIKKIIEVAQQHEYIPKEEFLFVPELRPYQEKIVDFICTYISKDMKAVGLDEEQMLGVFKFVFGRGWDSVYQWHKRPAGKMENVVTVGGNLLPGDVFLQLPDDIRYAINKIDAPRIIYGIMASWWEENQDDLRSKGIDIWSPLTVALSATFQVAVSMALKTFGYGK